MTKYIGTIQSTFKHRKLSWRAKIKVLSEKNIKLVTGATAAAYINGEPVSNEICYTAMGTMLGILTGIYLTPPVFLIGLYTNMGKINGVINGSLSLGAAKIEYSGILTI